MKNEYNDWIYRSLDIGLAVNSNGDIEVVIQEPESGDQGNLVFSKSDTKEEIVERIGMEVYDWIDWMKEEFEEEMM